MGAKRPLLVTLIGVLYLLLALLGIGAGVIALLTGLSVDLELQAFAEVTGGGMIVLGLIYLVVAMGFFKGWKLWWYIGVIFSIIGIILGLLSLPGGIIFIIIELIVLWYLFRDNVKEFFFD